MWRRGSGGGTPARAAASPKATVPLAQAPTEPRPRELAPYAVLDEQQPATADRGSPDRPACPPRGRGSDLMMRELLETVLLRNAGPQEAAWFRGSIGVEAMGSSATRFRAAFAGAGRRLGAVTPVLDEDEAEGLRRGGLASPERWALDTFARAALLLRVIEAMPPERHPDFVREAYRRGDFKEQAAVLQSLMLLPGPERFLSMAVEACRTNVRDVFEAIACENRYPATHFPDANFNQLVIKAFFIGLPVRRIAGLGERKTPELRRMAADYASERRAAGRPVPADLDLVLG